MKSRFSTLDIGVIVKELKRFLGMRVVNVYDVDNKTYLIRIAKPDEKAVILLESGIRLHSTGFDWPKNPAPSGFSMKMRKHLKSRRFENVEQLGVDRIVDMQFGSGEAAYHVVLELYDRGNIVLTDWEYTILNILRPRTDNSQDVRFAVREKYPIASAKHHEIETEESMRQILLSAKSGDQLKRVLVSHLDYGPAVIEHCLLEAGFVENVQIGKGFDISTDISKLMQAIEAAEAMMTTLLSKPCKGFIIQRLDKKPNPKDGENAELATYDEFHPFLFAQLAKKSFLEFESLDKAVDEFFSKLESQKLDIKVLQQERSALKKLDNVKRDHEKRITELQKEQEVDITRGQLVEMNLDLVDKAILVVRSALANQIDWTDIAQLVKEAQTNDDPVAKAIVGLKLDSNHITMLLSDPYDAELADEDYTPLKPLKVDIDLGLSAYANSRKFFEKKKHAAKKEQKTVEASNKALKSAEKKTKETLKDMATVASINKTRKTYWFEKFLWFISSENYLVIGGRDQQQNELIVKRYLKPGDLYVHADLHGASSVVVKNPTGEPVPPKTLNEAGTMAICNSAAWDAKVVTSAWWVNPDQVSKTAPSGEYLTTGSFMIRGKKNYLPPSYLIYGFGFLFKLEDGSIARHMGERRVRVLDEDAMSGSLASELESSGLDDVEEEEGEKDAFDDSDSSATEDQASCHDNEGEGDGRDTEEYVSGEELCEFEAGDVAAGPMESTSDRPATAKFPSPSLVEFPDTSINLTYAKEDKFELQRLHGTASCSAEAEARPSTCEDMSSNRPGSRLSAKQRREMRKAKKAGGLHRPDGEDERDEETVVCRDINDEDKSACSSAHILQEAGECGEDLHQQKHQPQQHQPPKRGQKGKLRKIKEKYKDQDEEERKLKMEILASSGPQKEDKKKKNKKGRKEPPAKVKPSSQQQSGKGQGQGSGSAKQTETIAGSGSINGEGKDRGETIKPAGFVKEEAPEVASDEEPEALEEDTQTQDDLQILNSLTGLPHLDDELLYAIPCCAPYNALTAYKYKVKLLPGTTKRGKAAKNALNMFQHDKSATPREKDLLRIMKDADLSRNMPGKVKVAAPNLHKR